MFWLTKNLYELMETSSRNLLDHCFVYKVAEEALAEVKLTESAKVRTRSYSGGMRRRLSVAISLIGDPKLVILDEPVR